MKYFIETAKCLSFSEAALRLYLSQPALSRHISAMESELNAQLFVRSRNKVRLTPAGQVLLEGLETLYGDYQALVDRVELANSGATGRLRVGILEYQRLPDPVSRALERLMEEHPEVRVSLSNGSYRELKERLYDQELDLAVTLALDVEDDPQLALRVFQRRPVYLALRRSHPLAGLERAAGDQLARLFAGERFLVMSPQDSAPAAERLIRDLRAAGLEPDIAYAQTAGQLALWLMAGRGIAVLNDEHLLFHDPALRFIPLEGLGPTAVAAAWNRARCNPLIPRLVSLLEEG